MRRTTMAVAAATCSGLLGLGLIAAPAAMAYPPGKEEKTKLSKSETKPGGRVAVEAKNAQPGCTVTYEVVNEKGKVKSKKTGTVGSDGTATTKLTLPDKANKTFTIRTKISGSGCAKTSSSATITTSK